MGSDTDQNADSTPRRRSPKPRGGKPRTSARQQAEKLVKQAGIPMHYALLVAREEMTLNEVLQRLALKDKVESLISQHDLPRSLATQVAMGQVPLDHVLRKRRLEAHLEQWREHSSLVAAVEHGRDVVVALHGKRWLTGRVVSVGRYEFTFAHDDVEESIHKLQAKLLTEADSGRELRRGVKRDKTRDAEVEPIWKPQDRYGCSDKRLFGYREDGVTVKATTLEGDVIQGTVAWMGRWEFGLTLKKSGVPVTVFRHALADIRPV